MEFYLVGGAVRDQLLGLPVKDRDWVVVGATPEQLLDRGFRQVGADFPVFLHPETGEEYALARTERKQGQGYHGFSVYSAPDVTLEQDLLRRDLTINAMAEDESGALIDPFDGAKDIRERLLRHVSDAFAEDPLRILRTARFAARFQPLGFRVCPETMALMKSMVAEGEVDHLVPERVWQELRRALQEHSPTTFFRTLRQCGALKVLIPELDQAPQYEAAMGFLDGIRAHSGTLEQRFAALLSPLGPDTARTVADRLKAGNDCKSLARLACKLRATLVEIAATNPEPATILELLNTADCWRRPERFAQLCEVLACTLPEPLQPQADLLQRAARACDAVNPRELMDQGIKGRALGQAIQQERLQRIARLINEPTTKEQP
ncbi:multifunctional CCA tRNA nucleotidyl transferase/2'3'-cyclic phosphodiesterase/2'nucleotidase/phosphatase [Marinobacter sp.]|jgi:tRNA nucleotidyltransferase (CCA-adding enzyme)|uniref:multifunctional CCA tRNA nucleotidyl transferase/2'3'-cyclic phosphodiesterase/2'nucleotidase/phosphatase n=1 Tax=Marinobacter sp. TaxID=50741 RepID=UPI0019C1A1ED|nr:multifunctional CCA tRNA nucleotidyl transferase/2'3'-cyclic phosphodiesterase/2'nucleotidase/phosphatase [Marinobacter sp.]MBC7192600.1 multifunctional CCA tRNA nucleotidyl transferase/2'3'-cyclic phosphodiesterase/2'nucleotidase/phosphatase [Marinobacter sp.]